MMKGFRAIGTRLRDGKRVMVEGVLRKSVWHYMVDGAYNADEERRLYEIMASRPAIGGTYRPEVGSELNVLAMLDDYFYGGADTLETDGEIDETMPSEPGVIY